MSDDPTRALRDTTRALRDRSFPTIGKFRIVREIGAGGMGVVYEAIEQEPYRRVALKVIRGDKLVTDDDIRLFRREADVLARLRHPGIATILESGRTEEGQHYFAMELISGTTLADWLAGRVEKATDTRRELEVRLALFRKITDAVGFAHQRGVIHRDLKPGNILVLPEKPPSGPGSGTALAPDIKVLDFGLAKIVDTDGSLVTSIGIGRIQGTLPFMSPEQAAGNSDLVDIRSDVYALGVVLYQMLAGALPYELPQQDLVGALRAIQEMSPKPIGQGAKGRGGFDEDVQTIVHKALEKEPARRYQSAQALGEDVDRYLARMPILAHPPSTMYQLKKLVQRNRIPVGVAAAFLILLVGFAGAMTVQARRIALEAERAQREAKTAEEVSSFLVGSFEVSDPTRTDGATVTAQAILDRGSERIEAELSEQPAVQARLLLTMGEVYGNLGLYDKSRVLLERARETAPSEESSLVASVRQELGIVARSQGNYEEAAEHLQAATHMRRESGDDDLALATAAHELGGVYLRLKDPGKAVPCYEEALAIRRRLLGPSHVEVSKTVGNLALAYQAMGDVAKAEEALKDALRIKEETVGADAFETSKTLTNLGNLYWKSGRPSEAEPLLERALAIKQRVLGEDHRLLASTAAGLGACRHELGKLEQAEESYRLAIRLNEMHTPEHPSLPYLYNNIALLCRDTDRMPEALENWRRAIQIVEEQSGPDAAKLNEFLGYVVDYHFDREEFAEAVPVCFRMLRIWGKDVDPKTDGLREVVEQLATGLRRLDRGAEADSVAAAWSGVLDQRAETEGDGVTAAK